MYAIADNLDEQLKVAKVALNHYKMKSMGDIDGSIATNALIDMERIAKEE